LSSIQYKCLNCKASLEFDPPSQRWKCYYCFSDFSKEELDAVHSVEDIPDEDQPELDSYHCNSCGAELIADGTTSATFCLYCKSSAIIKSRFAGRFKPRYLIPFRLTKAQAEELYRKWIRKKLFAPTEFKAQDEIEKVTGVYAPFWLFDCKTNGIIEGRGTKVRHYIQGQYRYTQTQHYRVYRKGTADYSKVPMDGSKKLDDTLMQLIEPYNYNDLTDFSMQYMSGFMAEKYDLEAEEAKKTVKSRVEGYTKSRLKETIGGYTTYHDTRSDIELAEATENYALLPVYLLVNKYKGKDHIFIVNGQTGKVVGDAPICRTKQWMFAGLVFAASWLLAVFGGAFLV